MCAQWLTENQINFLLILPFIFLEVFALWLPRAGAKRRRGRDWPRMVAGPEETQSFSIFIL